MIKISATENKRHVKHMLLMNDRLIKLNNKSYTSIADEIRIVKEDYAAIFITVVDSIREVRDAKQLKVNNLPIEEDIEIKRILSYKAMVKLAEESGF